jgi:CubicO group peptidase (beta-lactamase class C family)
MTGSPYLLRRGTVILALICTPLVANIAHSETEPPPSTIAELRHRIGEVLERTQIPGMICALVTRDEVLWVGGVGVADRATGRAADASTLFRVGSISKSFASLAVLILQERGQLSLDDVVNDVLPDAGVVNPWASTDSVRIKHLLEHTAGLDDIRPRSSMALNRDMTLREAVLTMFREVRWRPGTRTSYSNVGTAMAALVVETVTGQRYEDFVAKELFAPLDMKTATYFFDDQVARGYASGGHEEIPYSQMAVRPAGALSANATDMTRLLHLLLNRGRVGSTRILSPESIERMETPSTSWVAKAGVTAGHGLGNQLRDLGGFRYYGHDGWADGFLARYAYLPQHGVGYFFAVNVRDSAARQRVDDLIRGYLTRGLKPGKEAIVSLPPEHLRSYEGYYELDTPRRETVRFVEHILGTASVTADDGSLVVSVRPHPLGGALVLPGYSVRLVPVGRDQFRREASPKSEVVFLHNGEDWYMQVPDRTYRRIPAWSAWSRWLLAAATTLPMLSALGYAIFWVPFSVLRRHIDDDLALRLIPLAAVLCLLIGSSIVAHNWIFERVHRLGQLTLWSTSVTALTWLFSILTLLSVWYVWRTRAQHHGHVGVWWHAALVSAANLIALAYLSWWGIIGIRFWTL